MNNLILLHSNFFIRKRVFRLMKKLVPFLLTLLLLISCEDEVSFKNSDIGSITGQDFRLCACCGGWFIEIEGETLRIPVLPEDTDLELNGRTDFPILVQVVWEPVEDSCLGDEIRVRRIREIFIR